MYRWLLFEALAVTTTAGEKPNTPLYATSAGPGGGPEPSVSGSEWRFFTHYQRGDDCSIPPIFVTPNFVRKAYWVLTPSNTRTCTAAASLTIRPRWPRSSSPAPAPRLPTGSAS